MKKFIVLVLSFIKDYQLLIGLIVASLIIAWALGAFEPTLSLSGRVKY